MYCVRLCKVTSWLMTLPLEDQGFSQYKSAFRDALALWYNWLPDRMPTRCACNEPFTACLVKSQRRLPYSSPQWDSGYHVQPSVWSKSWCYLGAHTTAPWWTHSQICICNHWRWCQGRHTGQRILGNLSPMCIFWYQGIWLTHTHHPTRGFSSLPVMPIMNESIGARMCRGLTKLSWHPLLHSFPAHRRHWKICCSIKWTPCGQDCHQHQATIFQHHHMDPMHVEF